MKIKGHQNPSKVMDVILIVVMVSRAYAYVQTHHIVPVKCV